MYVKTSFYDQLNKDNSLTIEHRNLFELLKTFFKAKIARVPDAIFPIINPSYQVGEDSSW